ncbi:MAG: TM2 domain-containing protein [Bdellovibrionaceae bacterium]|nr:TM2 domain-containing protein [Pseudobdellovibrionaceae bacterium]
MSQTKIMTNETHSLVFGYVAWIFGFMGAHRFYYGRPISGTIYFCTLGLLGVGWIVDLFLIPSMDREADYQYKDGHIDYNIAWLLLIFLGYFGIHRLYMGKILTGILWMITGGMFGLGWLYDLWTLNEQIDEINSLNSSLINR